MPSVHAEGKRFKQVIRIENYEYTSNKFLDFFICKITNLDHLLPDCDFWLLKLSVRYNLL